MTVLAYFIVCIAPLLCFCDINFQFQQKIITLKPFLHLLWAVCQSVCCMITCNPLFSYIFYIFLWELLYFHWQSNNKQNIWSYCVWNVSYSVLISCSWNCCMKVIPPSQSCCYSEYQHGCDFLEANHSHANILGITSLLRYYLNIAYDIKCRTLLCTWHHMTSWGRLFHSYQFTVTLCKKKNKNLLNVSVLQMSIVCTYKNVRLYLNDKYWKRWWSI